MIVQIMCVFHKNETQKSDQSHVIEHITLSRHTSMPSDPDFITDGDDDEGYSSKGRNEVAAFIPKGKTRDVRFRTREGIEGVKEKIVGKYRACLVCKVIASEAQFFQDGCPNCPFLDMRGNREAVWDCTSPNFSGMIALMRPELSWAAKFNRIERCIPGCYAAEVYGELPERIKDMIS